MSLLHKPNQSIFHGLVYGLMFFLLWEWLRPFPVFTDTGELHVFVWFMLVCFVVVFLQLGFVLSFVVVLFASVYGLHEIFYGGAFFSADGGLLTVQHLWGEVVHNVGLLMAWQLYEVTDPFRTFVMFLLLALVSYLLYYWLFYSRGIVVFVLATVVYVAVLDTFTNVEGDAAIVRIVVTSFLLLSLLHLVRVRGQVFNAQTMRKVPVTWVVLLIVVVVVSTSVGFAAPKYEPQWRDPVPVIEEALSGELFEMSDLSLSSPSNGGGAQQVGYSDDDSELGGGFSQNTRTVFHAETDQVGYWRGESKNIYTGRGWEADEALVDADHFDYPMFSDVVDATEHKASVTFTDEADFHLFFYPGQMVEVNEESLSYDIDDGLTPEFLTDALHGSVGLYEGSANVRLNEYEMTFQSPSFDQEMLREAPKDDPDEVTHYFTDLPSDLPGRVGDLAEEITEGTDNRYDQAKAIEAYFKEEDFSYETDDVPVPEKGQDYVDQFLFETRRGYCDNFSTSMVVLLRTLDVPARWVKGFTEGDPLAQLDDGVQRYEVSNDNAHSWVEVFFPEIGWVPFEPTIGYDNDVEFEADSEEVSLDIDLDNDENEEDRANEEDADLEEDLESSQEEDESEPSTSDGEDEKDEGIGAASWFNAQSLFASVIVMAFVVVAYRMRYRLIGLYFLVYYRRFGHDERFGQAYQRLLWMLECKGVHRYEGETLREYAERVDELFSKPSMRYLTEQYEKLCYGGCVDHLDWKRDQKLWEDLLKEASS
ncbi:transglutaminase TgpA family protein [Texcoconibacillus texcoconensis]|uniref:Transglutaminase-like domain-containing protein n=1 Tax=Texcoconibacillus texcoconensis TaxID=1095777 RepID=A0A840QMG9_9BACI|nr:transglutaminase domain-containing protein [Texcoconibacillus texcoconensis]MBB5172574.1 hypothetical protein [Texcoconibacillus texcoconensis]